MKKQYIVGIVVVSIVIILWVIFLLPKDTDTPETGLKPLALKEAQQALAAGRLKEAKRLYQDSLATATDPARISRIRQGIEAINLKILFSSQPDECSEVYIVQPRDTLSKIARKFKTTVALIKRSNSLSSDRIGLKQKLKITTCKFSLVVDKSQNLLFLKRKGEVLKTYIVSTGKDNSTPVGEFVIDRNKLKNPTWFKTGAVVSPGSPENILGSRWMGLAGKDSNGEEIKGYGIHGTTMPEDLGKQITLGCVRMKNEDVEELFDIIPSGTEVVIVD